MIKKMQLPCVLIEGVPGENTVGWVGLFAMNTLSANGDLYKCVKAESGVYTWVEFGDGSGGSGGGTGADGYSPEAYVEQTDYGAVIHITDKSGTTEAIVYNGKDGSSITVTNVSETTTDGGTNVVTFSDGKKLNVKNGSKGSKGDTGETGAQGPKGDTGDAGADGKTPVKGTDYFTDADKQELVTAVLSALPAAEGVKFG